MKKTSVISTICLMLAAVSFTGCASINSVSLTPIPSNRAKVVRAEVERTIFLGFNFDNDYIDPLVSDLKQQCPNGVVSGILTKDETISYFIVFKKRVIATGFCNSAVAKSSGKALVKPVGKRRSASVDKSEAVEMKTDDAQVIE